MNNTIRLMAFMTALFFSSLSDAQTYDVRKNLYKRVTITWEHAADINKACRAELLKYGEKVMYAMDACAVWNGTQCKIITKTRPTEDSVGHEVMHCFQAHYHSPPKN